MPDLKACKTWACSSAGGLFVVQDGLAMTSWPRWLVSSVSVNYAFRSSGPRDPPHRPLHLAARPSPSYKDAFVSRRFSNTALLPSSFPSFTFLHGPPSLPLSLRASGPQPGSTGPLAGVLLPPDRYDRAGEKIASARPLPLTRSTPRRCRLVDHPTVGPPLDDDVDAAPGAPAARR
jgi:hypothetical protein